MGRCLRPCYVPSSIDATTLGEDATLRCVGEDPIQDDDVRNAWDGLAAYWDEHVEAGKTWQRHLIQPPVERLLRLEPGERILEIACGNGEFSRRMSELGGRVLATDFSEGMLERARSHGGDVEYRHVDATQEHELIVLGEPGSFDAVVCNMAIMDMEAIEPMVAAASHLLKPAGRFVFSTLHPAFHSGDARPTVELDPEGTTTEVYSVKVSSYGRPSTGKGVAIAGQPIEGWYFHRPLWMILEPFFRHGFALDGLEEPLLDRDRGEPGTPMHVYTQLPAVLVARMRRVA